MKHITDTMYQNSVVKMTPRGERRFIFVQDTDKKLEEVVQDINILEQVFFILCGFKPQENTMDMAWFILQGYDRYIEVFDNKVWVRTILV